MIHKIYFLVNLYVVPFNSRVREAERYNWAATRGVNEEMLFENLPEDLQREIRRHLFKFVKKVRQKIFKWNHSWLFFLFIKVET